MLRSQIVASVQRLPAEQLRGVRNWDQAFEHVLAVVGSVHASRDTKLKAIKYAFILKRKNANPDSALTV